MEGTTSDLACLQKVQSTWQVEGLLPEQLEVSQPTLGAYYRKHLPPHASNHC